MESWGGDNLALLGLVPLLMAPHRDRHLKGTGKTPRPFTGSMFNIPLTASVVDVHRVTSAALGLLKPEAVELSNTEKKQYQVKAIYRLQQGTGACRSQRMLPSFNPSLNPLLSTPAKEPMEAVPHIALPALQPSWRKEAVCMALSGWKALLEVGECFAGRSCRCPRAPGSAPGCSLAGLNQSPTSPRALGRKGPSDV